MVKTRVSVWINFSFRMAACLPYCVRTNCNSCLIKLRPAQRTRLALPPCRPTSTASFSRAVLDSAFNDWVENGLAHCAIVGHASPRRPTIGPDRTSNQPSRARNGREPDPGLCKFADVYIPHTSRFYCIPGKNSLWQDYVDLWPILLLTLVYRGIVSRASQFNLGCRVRWLCFWSLLEPVELLAVRSALNLSLRELFSANDMLKLREPDGQNPTAHDYGSLLEVEESTSILFDENCRRSVRSPAVFLSLRSLVRCRLMNWTWWSLDDRGDGVHFSRGRGASGRLLVSWDKR